MDSLTLNPLCTPIPTMCPQFMELCLGISKAEKAGLTTDVNFWFLGPCDGRWSGPRPRGFGDTRGSSGDPRAFEIASYVWLLTSHPSLCPRIGCKCSLSGSFIPSPHLGPVIPFVKVPWDSEDVLVPPVCLQQPPHKDILSGEPHLVAAVFLSISDPVALGLPRQDWALAPLAITFFPGSPHKHTGVFFPWYPQPIPVFLSASFPFSAFLYNNFLKHNSHTIHLTHVKHTIQWFLIYSVVRPSPQSIWEYFHHPESNPAYFSSHPTPIPTSTSLPQHPGKH